MQDLYADWLRRAVPSEVTFRTKPSELRHIESLHGDLDKHYDRDELQSIVDELNYSVDDARANRANPSKLKIDGDIRNNLASYKSAVLKYVRFRHDVELESAHTVLVHDTIPICQNTILSARFP